MDDGRTDGRTDDGRTTEHGYTISSPCEPDGSGELKKRGDAKAPYFLYIFITIIKGIYVRMNSLLKRSFAGNSPRFSFLTVSLYGTQKKKKKKKKKKVRHSPRCDFLTVSLSGTMKTINITYLLHI